MRPALVVVDPPLLDDFASLIAMGHDGASPLGRIVSGLKLTRVLCMQIGEGAWPMVKLRIWALALRPSP
jgi:hypothetical protein